MDKDGLTDDKWRKMDWTKDAEEGRKMLDKRRRLIEDEEDEQEKAKSESNAVSLVNDIRANRGIAPFRGGYRRNS